MRYLILIFVLLLAPCFADSTITATIEGKAEVEAWRLAKFNVVLNNEKGETLPSQKLMWKLFFKEEDKTEELRFKTTAGKHFNSFRPKSTGTFSVQVFLASEPAKSLSTYSFLAKPHTSYFKDLATGSACKQELGFVEWVDDIDKAREIAQKEKKPILLAYFVGCDVSGGLSKKTFVNEEFLALSEKLTCVPVILGGPNDNKGFLYDVPTGLCLVTLNSEGIYLGTHFRPSIEDLKKIVPTTVEKNQEFLQQVEQQKEQIKNLSEADQFYPSLQLARFYQDQKAFEAAIPYCEKAYDILGKYPENYSTGDLQKYKNYLTDNLLFLHMNLRDVESIIDTAEHLDNKTDYTLFSLIFAYHQKSEKEDEIFEQQAKLYFKELKKRFPGSTLIDQVERFLDQTEEQ